MINDRIITKPKKVNGFCGAGIFPLNIENVHLKWCISVDDDSESAFNSVAHVTSEKV